MPPGNITEITPEERQVLAGLDRRRRQGRNSRHDQRTGRVRGRLLTFLGDPAEVGRQPRATATSQDGLVVIEGGPDRRGRRGARRCCPTLPPGTPVDHYPDSSSCPGLIDTHIHYPADAGDRAPTARSCWNGCRNTPSSRSRSSAIRPTPSGSPASSWTSCCATAPPRPWSTAPSTRNRSRRSSPRANGATRG